MSRETSEKSAPRPLEVPPAIGEARLDALQKLVAIVDRLRAPDGCPWDREQTAKSVAPHLVEEAHEVLDAVEAKTEADVIEESGDLLMGICLLARIEEQRGAFSLADVANAVSEKLVRRHPHVFGDVQVDGAEQALDNWERIKQKEREAKAVDASALAGVPVALPALQRAKRMGEKAMAAGFKWTTREDALAKVGEEARELADVFAEVGGSKDEAARARLEHELGDVLLAAAFFGNYVKLDPERALREALRRFERRFRAVEAEFGGSLAEKPLELLMAAWQRAKAAEASADAG